MAPGAPQPNRESTGERWNWISEVQYILADNCCFPMIAFNVVCPTVATVPRGSEMNPFGQNWVQTRQLQAHIRQSSKQ